MQELTFCTTVSRSHLHYADSLFRSLSQQYENVDFHVLLIDYNQKNIVLQEQLPFNLLFLEQVEVDSLEEMKIYYSAFELSNALRPSLIKYLFNSLGKEKVVYLDTDIMVTGRFDAVVAALNERSFCLTPHITKPYPNDGKFPNNFTIASYGVYNSGFVAFKNSPPALKVLDFLICSNQHHCFYDRELLTSGGQRLYMLASALYRDCFFELNHPGYNVAYWNLHERSLSVENTSYFANGEPVTFFHFSGFDESFPRDFTQNGTRTPNKENESVLATAIEQYLTLLNATKVPRENRYEFDFYNGISLTKEKRRYFYLNRTFDS